MEKCFNCKGVGGDCPRCQGRKFIVYWPDRECKRCGGHGFHATSVYSIIGGGVSCDCNEWRPAPEYMIKEEHKLQLRVEGAVVEANALLVQGDLDGYRARLRLLAEQIEASQ